VDEEQNNEYRDRLSKRIAHNFSEDFYKDPLEYAVFAEAVICLVGSTNEEFLKSTFHRYLAELIRLKLEEGRV
jgi:hypothetical protein